MKKISLFLLLFSVLFGPGYIFAEEKPILVIPTEKIGQYIKKYKTISYDLNVNVEEYQDGKLLNSEKKSETINQNFTTKSFFVKSKFKIGDKTEAEEVVYIPNMLYVNSSNFNTDGSNTKRWVRFDLLKLEKTYKNFEKNKFINSLTIKDMYSTFDKLYKSDLEVFKSGGNYKDLGVKNINKSSYRGYYVDVSIDENLLQEIKNSKKTESFETYLPEKQLQNLLGSVVGLLNAMNMKYEIWYNEKTNQPYSFKYSTEIESSDKKIVKTEIEIVYKSFGGKALVKRPTSSKDGTKTLIDSLKEYEGDIELMFSE